jgi:hypothetical protein
VCRHHAYSSIPAEARQIAAIQAELQVKLGEIRRTYPGLSVESAFEALERENPSLWSCGSVECKEPPTALGQGLSY